MQHGRMFDNYSKRLTNKIWQLRLSINTIVSYYSNFHATAASRRWRVLLVKEYHQLCWWFQKALALPSPAAAEASPV